jgi:hypothetical protein
MRRFVIILVVLWLAGCVTQPERSQISSGTRVVFGGVAFFSPNEAGWGVHQSLESNEVDFGRFWSNQDTDVMQVKVIYSPTDSSDKELFADYQAYLDMRGPKPRFDFIKKNYSQLSFKQATCLKYDVVIDDHQVNKYIVVTGYGCRHPQDPREIVEFEVSQRSQSQELSPRLAGLGETFFDRVEFLTLSRNAKESDQKAHPAADYISGSSNQVGIMDAGTYCLNADLGHADAQMYIGDMHYLGAYKLKRDPVRAWVWYSLAEQKGDALATEQLSKVTAELTPEQLAEAKRQLATWQAGQCIKDLVPDQKAQ